MPRPRSDTAWYTQPVGARRRRSARPERWAIFGRAVIERRVTYAPSISIEIYCFAHVACFFFLFYRSGERIYFRLGPLVPAVCCCASLISRTREIQSRPSVRPSVRPADRPFATRVRRVGRATRNRSEQTES